MIFFEGGGLSSGIYKILNSVTGKVYVGSAVNVKRRFQEHASRLKKGCHANKKLQSAWQKYGEAAFEFSVIEYVDDVENLICREQCWIDSLGAFGSCGYNLKPVAGSSLGVKYSDESKAKMSAMRKGKPGRPKSEEEKQKLRVASTGRRHTAEARQKISNAKMGKPGRPMPDHVKELLTSINKGRVRTKEHAEKIAAKNRGRKHSEETRLKVSQASRGRIFSEEHKKKISNANKGRSKLVGDAKPRPRLTAEMVLAIRADPRPIKEIAADYGVHQSAISKIKSRKSWAHV